MPMSESIAVLPDASDGLVDEFGNGLVSNYSAAFFQAPAALQVQPQSQWYIAQWGQPIAINSADYTQNSAASYDPVYGDARYSWTEPGANSAIAIYRNTAALGGGDVYDLTDGNTDLPPSSGATEEADMFLSSPSTSASLANPITLSLNAKVAQSLIQFSSPALAAQYATSGTVFGTFDIGLTVNFNGADGLPAYSGYVQIVPWTSDSGALANYFSGAITPGDPSAQFIASTLFAGDPALGLLSADAGANPDTLSYNVNAYVHNALVQAFADFTPAQQAILLNMSNWTLGGVYIGPATNDAQTVSANGTTRLVAQETVGIQVSNISVTTNENATYNAAAPAAAGSEVDTNPQISFYDNTIQAGGTADGSVYSGPLVGVQDKYIYTGADNVSLTAGTGENWEFGGGSGLTELTAVSGNNIFVASTGSSYMVGGTGQDSFDIPDANVTGIGTWDSIENFHVGDQISLAGMAGPGWSYSWYAGLSVGGNSGLTLLASSTTTPGLHELVTLVGLSMGDLSSLKIAPDSSGNSGLVITRVDPQLQSYDLVTGVSQGLVSNANSNIAGINAEYIYTGTDSVALTAPVGANWEFGGGSAFSQLTAISGNNVFIASTGGSNMQGGSGHDTFMVPDANVSGVSVWDNIANFHSGDTLSLAGLAGAGWSYSWTDAYGTAANPALTIQATSTMTPGLTKLVTLTGLTMNDMASLSITHGSGAAAGTLIVSHH
jgi:hypothetical protein